jgi:F0F1-type ATP synthase membrane subunit b/b'
MLAGADDEAQTRGKRADMEADDIISAAREAGNAEKARLLKEAEARAVAVTKDADARAAEVAARSARESEREVARLAVLAAEKILAKHYD